jgi:hypothetical protein
MSDRIKGFVVALDKDYKDEDAERIKDALLMVKGVQGVTASIANHEDWINRHRVNHEVTMRILDALKDPSLS